MADDKKDTEKTSEPLSYGFVRNARWWYAAAWLFLLAINAHSLGQGGVLNG